MNTTTTNMLTSLPIYGLIASLTLFYNQIKSGATKFIGIFIKKYNVPNYMIREFYFNLKQQSYEWRSDNYRISTTTLFCKEKKRWLDGCYKHYKSHLFFYKNAVPVVLTSGGSNFYWIYYLKYTFNFDKFLVEILKKINDKKLYAPFKRPHNFSIEVFTGSSFKLSNSMESKGSLMGGSEPSKPDKKNESSEEEKYCLFTGGITFDNKLTDRFFGIKDLNQYFYWSIDDKKNKYQFTDDGKRILQQVEKWYSLREWYEERGICWRRGICLHGKPGNGKSSLILQVAKKAELPLYIFELSSMDNKEFSKYIKEIDNRPGILLFEDIDAVFNGRENAGKNKYNTLTFEYFINQLSGIKSIEKKFIFITTNNLEKLDPALIRPGRVDEIIEIKPLTMEEKGNLARIFIEDNDALVEECMLKGINSTTAEFENICTKAVLETIWQKSN